MDDLLELMASSRWRNTPGGLPFSSRLPRPVGCATSLVARHLTELREDLRVLRKVYLELSDDARPGAVIFTPAAVVLLDKLLPLHCGSRRARSGTHRRARSSITPAASGATSTQDDTWI